MRVTAHHFSITRLLSTRRASTTPAPHNSSPPTESIQALTHIARPRDTVRSLILRRHLGQPLRPDSAVSILRSCAANASPMEGRKLHAHMIVSGFDHDPFVCNHLINMYGKCRSLGDAHWVFRGMGKRNLHSWNTLIACYCRFGPLCEARRLFDEMPQRDSVSWNSMISGYNQRGPCEEALEIFVRMRRSGCRVDHFGVSCVISACSNLRFLSNGRELHGYSTVIGLDTNVQVGTSLIGLYTECMEIEDARRIFDGIGTKDLYTWNSMLVSYLQCSKIDVALLFFHGMPEKNVVSWTAMVAGCSQHEQHEDAISFFHRMREVGLRYDQVSFVSALSACAGLLDFEEGIKVHGLIVKSGFETNAIVGSVLVALYSKCGHFNGARSVIDGMPYIDDFTWSVMITEYAKHGLIDSARELFGGLEVKSVPLWNALIGGYSELGLDQEVLKAFKEMQVDGMKGDEFTFGSLLMGADLSGMRYGEQLHSQTIKAGIDSSVFMGSGLVDMYNHKSECEAAVKAFNAIREPNLVSWNSMISGYGLNNLDREAIYTFCLMMALGIEPDNVTFSLVLDSCSTLPALHEGTQVHALSHHLGFEADVVVGSALIDMYAKCEDMDRASCAFHDIHRHNVVSWTALLGGYIRCGMWDMAMELFNTMPERNLVSWNTMLSGYSKHGFWLEALHLYSQMNRSGLLPDHISFVSLLRICCNFLLKEHGRQVHAQIIKTGYHMNARVSFSLSDMYNKLDPMHVNILDGIDPDAFTGSS